MLLFNNMFWIFILISIQVASGLEDPVSLPGVNEEDMFPTFAPSDTEDTALQCKGGIQSFNRRRHKKTYRVGVHAIRSYDKAVQEYNKTYGEYLTLTAGQKFNPPIEFEMVPMTFEGIFDAAEKQDVDFFIASAAIYSCMATEAGAQPLATTISRLEARGHVYDLDVYGGVIAAHKDNDEINTIEDLKGKIIAAVSISALMDGQLQFAEMELAGLSYVKDPKQVVFTGNQFDVVNGVLDGEFDVGFVRTDTIERTNDRNDKPIDPSMFKIIEPKIHILDDGQLFPFLHSTPVFPEWPFASLTHVPSDISREVQRALIDFGENAKVGRSYRECLRRSDEASCEDLLCGTTKDIATVADTASKLSKISGFRTTGSYAGIRSMQETAGFLFESEKSKWKCTRSSNLYDGIKCPEGHFKRKRNAFEQGCSQVGLPCKEGYDCFCNPCIEANEADVYPYTYGTEDIRLADVYFGQQQEVCEKMSLCGVVGQTDTLTIRIYDNRERPESNITIFSHRGAKSEEIEVVRIQDTFAYEFNITSSVVGFNIIEMFMDGVQLVNSPILMQVVARDCTTDFQGEARVADSMGGCVCRNNAMDIGGRCIRSSIVFTIVACFVFLIGLQIAYVYLSNKKRQADNLWHVNVDELQFSEPVEIIGQGSFGVVLLAEYRGTKVAVKRVIPPREQKHGSTISSPDLSSEGNSLEEASKDGADVESQHLATSRDKFESKDFVPVNQSWSFNYGKNDSIWAKWFPWWFGNNEVEFGNTNVLMSRSFGTTVKKGYRLSCFDKDAQQKKDFMAEMRLLSRLRHPCITTVMGAVISPTVEPMLVMEYMDYGSLHDLLRNETMHTGGEVILQIVRDITQGLRYLHASKPPILHGDLKAKNILVDLRFRAKVGDFGLSMKKSNAIHGTPYWMAPEYLRRKNEYSCKCDMYSLGMVFFEIYARKNPYEGENPRHVLHKVCNPRVNMRPDVPETCPPKMTDIMKKCWSPDPSLRPTSRDLDLLFMDMNIQDVEPLTKEQQRINRREERTTKEILYDVFPKHIADALNAGKKVEPESHDMVTVVFSDIVGFTTISRESSPLKVSNMLDRLYLAFDGLARKHGIFKVETIGDAYMGVTNLNESHPNDHVKRVAEFAMDLVDAARTIAVDEENPEKGVINVRVGFHSGPVVSNVIGSLNPRYGLFGDTVNTASRMESNSTSNRILCSERAATILKKQAPDIRLSKRGKIGVKGKGNMVTYWIGDLDEHEIVLESIKSAEKQVLFDLHENSASEIENDRTQPNEIVAQEKGIEQQSPEAKVDNASSTSYNIDESISPSMNSDKQETKVETSSSPSDKIDHGISSLYAMNPEKQDNEVLESDDLLDWVVEILSDNIKKVVAVRKATTPARNDASINGRIYHTTPKGTAILDEVTNKISMPEFNSIATASTGQHKSIDISPSVTNDLKEFVTIIKTGYKSNQFHNFEHSCHVTLSLHKLLQSMLENDASQLHDMSYGISSDPMVSFALVFSAIIHDVDHQGVSNQQLSKEQPLLAARYGNRSIAEQNSFDIAWEILMFKQFDEMRQFIFGSQEELLRFRQLVVNVVLATDIFDTDSSELRKERWRKGFSERNASPKSDKELNDQRACLILEQIIQAADVSHTMQHWCVYQKWNKQLFNEMSLAYRKGRLGADPATFWYQSELGFLDSYVIPMTIRLKECNLFGTNSDDFIKYAVSNRAKWALCGQDIVTQMVESFDQERVDVGSEEKKE